MQGNHLALEHHAVLPVQELHRLSQVQMAPNLDDPARIGQHPVDDGVQHQQLPVAGLAQQVQQAPVNGVLDHAASRITASGRAAPARSAPMFQGSNCSIRLMGWSAMRVNTSVR